jgi:hypothetical protein
MGSTGSKGRGKGKKSQNKKNSDRKRVKRSRSACSAFRKSKCGTIDPRCSWRKRTGCVFKKGSGKARSILDELRLGQVKLKKVPEGRKLSILDEVRFNKLSLKKVKTPTPRVKRFSILDEVTRFNKTKLRKVSPQIRHIIHTINKEIVKAPSPQAVKALEELKHSVKKQKTPEAAVAVIEKVAEKTPEKSLLGQAVDIVLRRSSRIAAKQN